MTVARKPNPPNSHWPVGTPVTFVDAYGEHPRSGKVTRHYGTDEMLIEEPSGVVDCAQTWRVTSAPLITDAALLAMFE